MHILVEGLYHQGKIELKKPLHLKENSPLKVLIISEGPRNTDTEFGVYRFGNDLDAQNIRDLAHED